MNNQEYINSILNVVYKLKEIPAIVNINDRKHFARINFEHKNNNTFEVYFDDNFKIIEKTFASVAFFCKGILYVFETELDEAGNITGTKPIEIFSSFKRVSERIKANTQGVIYKGEEAFKLDDFGSNGFSLSATYEAFTQKDYLRATLLVDEIKIEVGAIIRTCNIISDTKSTFDAQIICIDSKSYDRLLAYLFDRILSEFEAIFPVCASELISLYKKSLDLAPVEHNHFRNYLDTIKIVEDIEQIEAVLKNEDISDQYYPLTFQQQGMWNIEQVYADAGVGIVSGSVISKELMDFSSLEKAINLCVQTNDTFWLQMTLQYNEPKQYLKPFQYKQINIQNFENYDEYITWRDHLTNTPFCLVDTELYYFEMFHVKNGCSGYYFKLHHLVVDAYTSIIMTNQIMGYYNKIKDKIDFTPVYKPSYIDFIQKESDYLFSKTFWKNKQFWDGIFETFPKFNVLKPYVSSKSVKADRLVFNIRRELTKRMNEFCTQFKTTPYTLFISVLTLYVNKLTSKDDIVIGTAILNRSNARERQASGMYANIIPFRFGIDTDMSFADFVQQTGKQIMNYFRNQKYPYDLLLQDFKKKHKSDKLYDMLLSYQNFTLDEEIVSDNYEYVWNFSGYQTESLCFHVDDRDLTGEYVVNMDYLVDAFDKEEITKIFEYITNLFDNATANPLIKLSDLNMISEAEKYCLLKQFNEKTNYYPKDKVFHQIFEENAKKHPQKIAAICNGKELTYKELNSRANQLARHLRAKGVCAETVVGIIASRSIEAIIGIFAISKAGGAYLPIDPNYPEDRIQYILEESQLDILLTDKSVNPQHMGCDVIYIDDSEIYSGADSDLDNINKHSDLMYVIYTSGSTGNPKGVMIEHGNFMSIAYGWKKEYRLDDFEVTLLQLASFSFDVFTGDLARTFINGGTMIVATEEEKYSFPKLYNLINTYNVSLFESTPQLVMPLFEFIYNHKLKTDSLKLLIIGSDVCLNNDFRKLAERFEHFRIINSYGVTEATIDSSYYEASVQDIPSVGVTPIGKPFGNSKFYILGEHMELKPIGVIGELYIAGKGIARGYFNNPELSASRFLSSPFAEGEKVYKTGDLAKWLPDGNVAFLGRADTQVKVRGFRIELGEIENKILTMDQMREAVVLVDEGILYAFYVSEKDIDPSEIKEYLYNSLPNYMVPTQIKRLSALPLTPNGKVDKIAILEQNHAMPSDTVYIAPENDTEKELCMLWAEALEKDKVGVCDNFFDIGGDSLAAINILSAAYERDWSLSIQDFYKYQTIREMAAFISKKEELSGAVALDKNYSRVIFKHDGENLSVTKNHYQSRNLLITGATGFLGIHILFEMLKNSSSNIYCLVRGDEKKLIELFDFYFKEDVSKQIGKRVFIIRGDVADCEFGLIGNEYTQLAKSVDMVIHSAALVKHYGDADEFEKINVVGTEEIIQFCRTNGSRLIYISTTSVSGDTVRQDKELDFCENDFYIGQNVAQNIYIKTKFDAENLVLKAMEEDLDATILRVGNLTGRMNDGVFQKNIQNSMFYNMIRSIVSIKAIPSDISSVEIEMTPIDLCCRAISEIIHTKESSKKIFHLFNDKKVEIGTLMKFINELGYFVLSMDKTRFMEHIKAIDGQKGRSALFLVNDYNFEKIADKRYNVNISADITSKYLKKLNFNWNDINKEYISKIIKHAETVKFLE